MRGTLTMKWTIRELLHGMLMVALITGVYWNVAHGHISFVLWLAAVLYVPLVVWLLYHFVRHKRVIFLVAAIVCACIGVGVWWRIFSGG